MKFLLASFALLLTNPAFAKFEVPGLELVYTAPVETKLEAADLRAPVEVWVEMINSAKKTLEFGQMYAVSKAERAPRKSARSSGAGGRTRSEDSFHGGEEDDAGFRSCDVRSPPEDQEFTASDFRIWEARHRWNRARQVLCCGWQGGLCGQPEL